MEDSWSMGAVPGAAAAGGGRLAVGDGFVAGGRSKLPDCRMHQWWCAGKVLCAGIGQVLCAMSLSSVSISSWLCLTMVKE